MLVSVRTGEACLERTDLAPRALRARPEVWLVAGITAVGAVLRFATLATQSYWVDEATTVHYLHMSLGPLLHALSVNESTPPLYYLIAWVWAKVFGTGEVGLRSLSALLGTAVVLLAYLGGRELVSQRAGMVAAALAAVNPFMIWYSQEARAYMLLAAMCGLSLLFFARCRRQPTTANLGGWAAFSALAMLTHFFAGFIVAPEAILLLLSSRQRATVVAVGSVAGVQAALVPLLINDVSHPLLGWIKDFPLSVRIQQVPVDFGLGTLYQSPLVNHGLLIAGVLAAVVATLVVLGGGRQEQRGAAIAATLAAVVIAVPLILAELGRDYYVVRNLIPAWIPLAVLLGAACTAPRTRAAGAALGAVLLIAFVAALVKIDSRTQYQRPNWRGVASALGGAAIPRAIVAYDGQFAAEPLAIYLPGVPWTTPGKTPVSVGEVDVVGSVWQTVPRALPAGVRLMSSKPVDDFRVVRLSLNSAWRLLPAAIGARAGQLLTPAPPNPAVLLQHSTSASS